jgi:hypothetical protein
MKAKEFVINVPINIKIDGNGDPQVDMPTAQPEEPAEPVMMTPQEQELELKKAELGKESKYIDQLIDEPEKPEQDDNPNPFPY